MSGLGLATRGYIGCIGGRPAVAALALLHPETATVAQNSQLLMTVVFTVPVVGDTVVSLASDTPGSVTVPASVTVLDGDATATFFATTLAIGTAQISATSGVVKTADITVAALTPGLKPEIHRTVNLKPIVSSAQNIRPKIYDTEES